MVRKRKIWLYILISVVIIALAVAVIFGIYITKNESYAAEEKGRRLAVEIPIQKKR